jgi:hypothetical protein
MKRAAATIILAITLLALVVMTEPMSTPVHADDPNQVGLVVRFSNGSTFTACVEFSEPELTGEEVLDRSGLSIVRDTSYGLGAAICKIEGDGCDYPAEPCFCQCEGVDCEYWAYYHLDNGEWIYSGMGATWHTVQHGDVEGWSWGAGDPSGSDVEPPLIPFDQLCAQPATEPPVVSFTADPENIMAGRCAKLEWRVENADFVVLDGAGVPFEYTREVCPTSTQTYELRVANSAGEFEYRVTINVTRATTTPTSTRAPTSTPTRLRTPTATRRPTNTPQRGVSTPTPTREASSLAPSPTPSSISVGLPAWQLGTPTAAPTASPTVVAMAPPAVEEPVAPPPEEAAPAEPSASQGVTLDRILLLIGVSVGTLGFGGLAFIAIILILIAVYLRARVWFTGDKNPE